MNASKVFASVCWLGLTVTSAWAAPDAAAPTTAAQPAGVDNWGLSAGVGFGTVGLTSLGGVVFDGASGGALGGVARATPTMSLGLERRLSAQLWALGDAQVMYRKTTNTYPDTGLERAVVDANTRLAFGLRYNLRPEATMQVSTFGMVGGSYAYYRSDATDGASSVTTSHGVGGHLQAGLIVDWAFADAMMLRVKAPLVRLEYSTDLDDRYEAYSAQFALWPSLYVRFAF
jgi:hypothetical protein